MVAAVVGVGGSDMVARRERYLSIGDLERIEDELRPVVSCVGLALVIMRVVGFMSMSFGPRSDIGL